MFEQFLQLPAIKQIGTTMYSAILIDNLNPFYIMLISAHNFASRELVAFPFCMNPHLFIEVYRPRTTPRKTIPSCETYNLVAQFLALIRLFSPVTTTCHHNLSIRLSFAAS